MTLDCYRTAHCLRKLTHHPKAKAKAAGRTTGDQAFELFEDASLVVGADAEAMVSDLKANLAGVACRDHIDWFPIAEHGADIATERPPQAIQVSGAA
jgi:hypothetical protein